MRSCLLVSTILIMSVVIAAGVMGYKYYKEQYQQMLNIKFPDGNSVGQFDQDVKPFLAFVVSAAGLIVIINLIVQFCQPKLTKIMLIWMTMLLLAICFVLAMQTSHTYNFRNSLKASMKSTDQFVQYEEKTYLREFYDLLNASLALTIFLLILWIYHHFKQSDFLLPDVTRYPITIIVYIFTILLSGLMFATVERGSEFFSQFQLNTNIEYTNLSKDDYLTFMIFIILAAALVAICSLIHIIMTFIKPRSTIIKQFLLIFGAAFLFALAVSLAIRTSETSNLRKQLYRSFPDDQDLDLFYILLIASTVSSFFAMLLWLLLIIQTNYKLFGGNIQFNTINNNPEMNNIAPTSEKFIVI